MMFELPLFPLNTVLFPGMPIALHIFEERYIEMIGACLSSRQPFGIVLIQRGQEALGPLADTYPVGCSAEIIDSVKLEQGRMNINAMGKERFRIMSIKQDEPYLVGKVATFPLQSADDPKLVGKGKALRPWIDRYLDILSNAGEFEIDSQLLPEEPIALAFLGAILLQMPQRMKQQLLEIKTANNLLLELRHDYRREVALLAAMLDRPRAEEGPFTTN